MHAHATLGCVIRVCTHSRALACIGSASSPHGGELGTAHVYTRTALERSEYLQALVLDAHTTYPTFQFNATVASTNICVFGLSFSAKPILAELSRNVAEQCLATLLQISHLTAYSYWNAYHLEALERAVYVFAPTVHRESSAKELSFIHTSTIMALRRENTLHFWSLHPEDLPV